MRNFNIELLRVPAEIKSEGTESKGMVFKCLYPYITMSINKCKKVFCSEEFGPKEHD